LLQKTDKLREKSFAIIQFLLELLLLVIFISFRVTLVSVSLEYNEKNVVMEIGSDEEMKRKEFNKQGGWHKRSVRV
jgi:hypothetical protein